MDKIIKILIAAFVIALIYAALDSGLLTGWQSHSMDKPSGYICAGLMILLWGAIVIKKLSND